VTLVTVAACLQGEAHPLTAPRQFDILQSGGHARRFEGKRREIESGLRRDGTIRRSFSRTAAGKLAGGRRRILPPLRGSADPPLKN
jgi:hypothetical protein